MAFKFGFTDHDRVEEIHYGYPAFFISPFYAYDLRGRNIENKVLAYEICEKCKNYQTNQLSVVHVLQFATYSEAKSFLQLFMLLLNHGEESFYGSPELQACRREISKQITAMLANAPLNEIAERHARREQILKQIRESQHPELTRIYAIHFDNNCTKIGISEDVYRRMNQLETPPIEIDSFAYTQTTFTREQARMIEEQCHKHFRDRHRYFEYFNISFDEACEKLQEYSTLYIALNKCQRYVR